MDVGSLRPWLRGGVVKKCCGKNRYPTQQAAAGNAAYRVLRGDQSALRIYECDRCSGWHLTKRIERKAS